MGNSTSDHTHATRILLDEVVVTTTADRNTVDEDEWLEIERIVADELTAAAARATARLAERFADANPRVRVGA